MAKAQAGLRARMGKGSLSLCLTIVLATSCSSAVERADESVLALASETTGASPESTSTTTPSTSTTVVPTVPVLVVPSTPDPLVVTVDFSEPPGATDAEVALLKLLSGVKRPGVVRQLDRSTNGSFSPDGTRIAYAKPGQVCLTDLATATEQCTDVPGEFEGRPGIEFSLPFGWSPDGTLLVVSAGRGDGLWLLDSVALQFSRISDVRNWAGDEHFLSWTQSGKILVAREPHGSGTGEIAIVDLDESSRVLVDFPSDSIGRSFFFGAYSEDLDALLTNLGGLSRIDRSGTVQLPLPRVGYSSIDLDRDASVAAFITADEGGFQEIQGPAYIVDIETNLAHAVAGQPVALVLHSTGNWLASVYEEESTVPRSVVITVAPVSDPGAAVEVFRSNSDELFLRSDRPGGRNVLVNAASPQPVWTDSGKLLLPLSQQGSILEVPLPEFANPDIAR